MSTGEKPPLFKTWSTWYTIVLGALVIQFIFYLFITMVFS